MSMVSMCSSRFAASLAWVPRAACLSGGGIHRSSFVRPLPLPERYGQGVRLYNKDRRSYDRSPVMSDAARKKKRFNAAERWTPGPPPKKKGDLNLREPKPPSSPNTLVATDLAKRKQVELLTATFVPEPGNWEEFIAPVSGEWEGSGAEFNLFAEPRVLPPAFRQGDEKVYDWQTVCSTVAHPDNGRLWYKVVKLNPVVNPEADTFVEADGAIEAYRVIRSNLAVNPDPSTFDLASPEALAGPQVIASPKVEYSPVVERDTRKGASALVYHSSGSYTGVWPGKFFTNKKMVAEEEEVEVEQCFVYGKTRLRVFQKLGRRRHIFIFREALGGGAAAPAAFATEKKLAAASLFGQWSSEIYTLKNPEPRRGYTCRELVLSGTEVIERNWSSTFLFGMFPKDTWTLLMKTESGATTIETGWLVEPDVMLVTKCEVGTSGDLKDVSLRVEKRVSSEVAPLNVTPEDLEEMLTE